ncbi:TIGR01244 family phosphatase [Rhizobium daejeonense]|uniref:TIGR01244 family phosphatase n=1 Tax=Rhizobium daejeonense TaxID=240521 RepID=A0A6M1S0Y9_9HYPH|nr:TIGR01244 family sulfur transferase [Rhizobium daejeonense]NGO64653.1 TIGR01244 family phosphatase [Rhizobium daejeonense]
MQIRPITKSFHVSGQLAPTDIPQLAASGYSMVICMRPDGEGWGQPDFSVIEDAAKAAGLKSYYLPVVPGSVSLEQATKLKDLLKQTEGPVLAFCASGARCAGLYQMSQQIG